MPCFQRGVELLKTQVVESIYPDYVLENMIAEPISKSTDVGRQRENVGIVLIVEIGVGHVVQFTPGRLGEGKRGSQRNQDPAPRDSCDARRVAPMGVFHWVGSGGRALTPAMAAL